MQLQLLYLQLTEFPKETKYQNKVIPLFQESFFMVLVLVKCNNPGCTV